MKSMAVVLSRGCGWRRFPWIPEASFFKNHPDLLVQSGEAPKIFWESYGLDLTNPKALEFVRETFHRVFHEWGFTYIKIDFLLHAVQPGTRVN